MQEESLDEGRCLEGEEPLDPVVLSIAIAKGHKTLFEGHQPFVSDGDAMGITAQVTKHLRGARHGRLAVDDPLFGRRLAYQPVSQRSAHARGSGPKRPLEAVEELASEDPREDTHRHQEAGARSDPPVPRYGQTAAGHDAVDVRVKSEGLGPGVQDGDAAGQGPQPTPAASKSSA